MLKPTTTFLLVISIGLFFAGAVSAAQTVDVGVVDGTGNQVTETSPGDQVVVGILVSANDATLNNDWVEIPQSSGLKFQPENTLMRVGYTYVLNDLSNPFFYYDNTMKIWVWDFSKKIPVMQSGASTDLVAPATVTSSKVNVKVELYKDIANVADTDSYLIPQLTTAAPNTDDDKQEDNDALQEDNDVSLTNTQSVPMQTTGTPIALAVLGLLAMVGGSVYGRIK